MSRVATPGTTQTTPSVPIARDKVAQRAYEKWLKRGRPHGTDLQDWLEAEAELRSEANRGATPARR